MLNNFCRWKIDCGKALQLIGGETLGQTHVAYASNLSIEDLVFNHPIDVHFAELGIQVSYTLNTNCVFVNLIATCNS
jgi:hypothetical protein